MSVRNRAGTSLSRNSRVLLSMSGIGGLAVRAILGS
jgi:hypothetical protein